MKGIGLIVLAAMLGFGVTLYTAAQKAWPTPSVEAPEEPVAVEIKPAKPASKAVPDTKRRKPVPIPPSQPPTTAAAAPKSAT